MFASCSFGNLLRNRILPLFAVLQLVGCLPEDIEVEPDLPAATQTGANTAGCRVDGLKWIAIQTDIFGPKPVVATFSKLANGRRALTLLLGKSDDSNQVHSQTRIGLYVPHIRSAGTFDLVLTADPALANTNPAYGVFQVYKPAPGFKYLTGPAAGGRLIITRLDTASQVVAGTFEFMAADRTNPTPVRVTEGRFDIRY